MIAVPTRAPRTLRTVVLEKHAEGHGGLLLIGARFTWTYLVTSPHLASHRAHAALRRDHPGEHASDWHEVTE